MKVLRDNIEYQGTPKEIADLFSFIDSSTPQTASDDRSIYGTLPKATEVKPDPNYPFQQNIPMEDLVSESEQLRKKLAADPDYSPYPGVSKSPENEDKPTIITPSAELNTGVEYV